MARQTVRQRGIVDLVFLVDVTGSMSDCINKLQELMMTFIDELTSSQDGRIKLKSWRGKAVGFRDFEYPEDEEEGLRLFEDNPFVSDVDGLKEQLTSFQAAGGGPDPESLLDSLFSVLSMPHTAKHEAAKPYHWRSGVTRVILAFTDAEFYEEVSYTYRHDEETGTTVKDTTLFKGAREADLINVLAGTSCLIYLFAPDADCYNNGDLKKIPGVTYEPMGSLNHLDVNGDTFGRVFKALAGTIRNQSIRNAANRPKVIL